MEYNRSISRRKVSFDPFFPSSNTPLTIALGRSWITEKEEMLLIY
jgi:hypothetical protein